MHKPRLVVVLLAMIISIVACGMEKDDSGEAFQRVVPEARPAVILLQAAKAGDLELLKTAFSVPMKSRVDRDGPEGWEELLNTYQELFSAFFGEYSIDEFEFEFAGSEAEGEVTVRHSGQEFPGLYVVIEDGGWKLNES